MSKSYVRLLTYMPGSKNGMLGAELAGHLNQVLILARAAGRLASERLDSQGA